MLCLAVHTFEVLAIRTDETFIAECFINKVFGIILLYVVLTILKWHWRDIGFIKQKLLPNVLKGFMEFFVTGFSLTGNVVKQTGFGFVLMCIGFNIINVWMEEGLFRGFYITYIAKEHSKKTALYVAAFLFGLWHLVTPFRILHVVTDNGVDELQIVRVLIGELTSFIAVIIYFKIKTNKISERNGE